MLILSLLLITSSPFMPTTEAINCFNCTIASEGSQSVDQCKNFDSQTPTCPPSQYCISFSGIMHEESKVIDSKIYTCDTVLYQNHFSWALKGKIKTGFIYNLTVIGFGAEEASDICKTVGDGCHNFGNQTQGGVTIVNMEVCCCDTNL